MIRLPLHGILLTLIVIASGRIQAQLLKNPGFETAGQTLVSTSDAPNGKAQISGTIAEGWLDNTGWADVSLVYSMNTANPHTGHSCQQIVIKRGFLQFAQPLQLSSGYYRASVWMRADSPAWVSVSIRQGGAPYASYAAHPAMIGSQWTRIEASGTVPKDEQTYLLINAESTGTIYVDDAEVAPSTARSVTLKPPTVPIPLSYFGFNINHMHDAVNIPWPAVPFGTYRTWDSGIVWALLEPKKGEFNWSRLDKDVAEAKKRGIQILLTLGFTPQWASSDPDNKTSAYGALGATAPPADINDWKDFIRAVATRYKGLIYGYEIWNEPDGAGFYSGTAAQLVPLEKAAREVLRVTDPAAVVVTPAPSSGNAIHSLKWMGDYFAAGGGKNADIIGVHMYNTYPEDQVEGSALFHSLLTFYHMDKKPLWNTETGWGYDGKSTDEETSAYVARAFVLNWATNYSRYCWYSWSEVSQVGIRPDTQGKFKVLAPAAKAYVVVEKWLIGSKMLACGMDAKGIWTAALLHPDGSRAWILWCTGSAQSYIPSPLWKVKRSQDLTGEVKSLSRQRTISVGPAPILLLTK